MLSIGPGAPRFSPSQDIRVILSLPRVGNVHYRQHTPTSSQSGLQAGRAAEVASPAGSYFLLSRMSPIIRRYEQGKEAVVALLGTGDFFGEGRLTGQPLRLATVSAMTECVIVWKWASVERRKFDGRA